MAPTFQGIVRLSRPCQASFVQPDLSGHHTRNSRGQLNTGDGLRTVVIENGM